MRQSSIIIVSWNAKQYLMECLKSLQEEHDCLREIIVVDNASSDGSPEAVKQAFPEVNLIENRANVGFARANNIGMRASTGKYILLINSDVIVLKDCIDRLIKYMDANPSVGMAGPRTLNPDGTLQVSCRHFPSLWNNLCQIFGFNRVFQRSRFFSEPFMQYWAHDETRSVDAIRGCFWIVRREALDQVGLLDERFFFYGEDIDWCKRFHEAGWDVVFYPEAEAIHYGGASSRNAPIEFYMEMQKADLQYWTKHHGHFGRTSYLALIVFRETSRLLLASATYVVCPKQRECVGFKVRRSAACIVWALQAKDHESG